MNSFAYNLLAESAWRKHIICLSRNDLFQHDGILYRSWLANSGCGKMTKIPHNIIYQHWKSAKKGYVNKPEKAVIEVFGGDR